MPGTNQYVSFAAALGANTLSNAAWQALTTVVNNGFVAGTASSTQANTLWRQTSTMAAAIGKFIAAAGFNATDDGNAVNLQTAFLLALRNTCLPLDGGTVNGDVNVNGSLVMTQSGSALLTVSSDSQPAYRLFNSTTVQSADFTILSSNLIIKTNSNFPMKLQVWGVDQIVLPGSKMGLFGSPVYQFDIKPLAGTDMSCVLRANAGLTAAWSLAGNGNNPFSTGFDLMQDSTSTAYLWQRANAALRIGTNNTEAIKISSSQVVSLQGYYPTGTYALSVGGLIAGKQGAAGAPGGLIGSNDATDVFVIDTDKHIHRYGIQWCPISTVAVGALAHLSGYGGVQFYSGSTVAGSFDSAQRWVLGGPVGSGFGNAKLTIRGEAGAPFAWADGPSGAAYMGFSHTAGASTFGYLGQESGIISGGSASKMTLRGEGGVSISIAGTKVAAYDSGSTTFFSNGASSNIVKALSTTGFAAYSLGRAAAEHYWGCAASSNDYTSGTVAGDMIALSGANAWIGSQGAFSVSLFTNSTARLKADASGNVWVRPDLGLNTNLTDLTTRSHGSSGFQKLPGGLILQWGVTSSISTQGTLGVTFPTSFPTACGVVMLSPSTDGGNTAESGATTAKSTSGFTVKTSGDNANSFYWMAIGW